MSEKSARLEDIYGVNRWGQDYFSIDNTGDLCVHAPFYPPAKVSLRSMVDALGERGLETPVLLRVENLLDHRISCLNEAFAHAIKETGYNNVYRGVFPIKVNQQSHVIEELTQFGERYHHGLEAGSKAELIIALSHSQDSEALIICNGYKDSEFIDLGLHAIKLGRRCFFVVETLSELSLIIERSRALSVKPLIGIRLKLVSKVDGHWSNDSGDRSIFGLSGIQLINAVEQLKQIDMLDCLQLLHFHLGSQIPNIRNIRSGMLEACRYYIELVKEGAPLGYIDLGGGLAVDYDGSHSNGTHSMNYGLNEYCVDVVESVMFALNEEGIDHPVLITESGRATVAYSSILLFNILEVSDFKPQSIDKFEPNHTPGVIKSLQYVLNHIESKNLQESYNDGLYYRDEAREQFKRGQLNLRERACAENYFLHIMRELTQLMESTGDIPSDMEHIHDEMADIYYGNFSLFQSLPDSWAIDQVFPVMPIQRLNEAPTRHAIIADITCDCDGKIDRFALPDGIRSTLPVHDINSGDPYYMGVFLVGAYQETLGDLHNLFGDTNVASVRINPDASFTIVTELEGDRIADVLSYVEYQPARLKTYFRNIAEQAVEKGLISVSERQTMLKDFNESLNGYTYYEQ